MSLTLVGDVLKKKNHDVELKISLVLFKDKGDDGPPVVKGTNS